MGGVLRGALPLFVLGLVSSQSLKAQTTGGDTLTAVQRYVKQAGDHAALYRGRFLTTNHAANWLTHPYWESDKMQHGQVCFDGLVYPDVLLRYDAHNNLVEVQTPVGQHIVIPDQPHIQWFSIGELRFVPSGDRFVALPYEGRCIHLVHDRQKVRDTQVIVDNHARDNLKVSEHYEVCDAAGLHPVKNARSLQKLYPQYARQLSAYVKANGLTFRKDDRPYALAMCVAWLDRQMAADATVKPAPQVMDTAMPQTQRTTSATVPVEVLDSVLHIALNGDLPSWQAYRPGGRVQRYDDEVAVQGTAGVRAMSALEEDRTLPEVEVTAFQSKLISMQTGYEKFRPRELRNVPMSMGESDLMKMLQTTPGVSTMGEASSGFNVRGGASDQNLLLLSGNTIYNAMHMFGLFSVFNTDAIGDVELFKSGIPAQYGGRISSVMNMQVRQASKQKFNGSASLGLLTSKANLDIPLVKDKVSLMLAGRTTYSDWMLKLLPSDSEYRDGRAGFYDLNASLAWTVNRRHFVNVYGYFSHDRFRFSKQDRYAYEGGNGSVEWKSFWNDRLSSVIQAGFDHYDYLRDDLKYETSASRLTFNINQMFLKGLFNLQLTDANTLRFGWNALVYNVMPGQLTPVDSSSVNPDKLERQRSFEGALHVDDEWHITPKLTATAGLRLNVYSAFLEGLEKTYCNPDARLALNFAINDNQSVKAGFNTMHQYVHKLSNTVIMSPTDTWTLSDAAIRPQNGYQASIGYYWRPKSRVIEASVEVYYKGMSNYLTYRNAAQLTMNHELRDDVFGAKGKAYGIELQLRKSTGKLTGWLSYAFSRTFLRQPAGDELLVNDGSWFPADFDHPHEINFVANYKFTQRYSFSLNADYSTGRPITVPAGCYFDHTLNAYQPFYTQRNSYRIPDNFRVDVAFNFNPSHHLTNKTHSWFSIGCYNVLGRRNAYSVYFEAGGASIKGYKLSVFGSQIPFVSYNIKF